MENVQDSVSDHLKCPICVEIPRDKMFQCRNGHPFCEDCCKKFPGKACHQCKDPIPKIPIRCMVVEEMLDSTGLKFPCQFQGAGCPAKKDRRDIGEHNSSCKYDFERFGNLENVCGRFGFKNCSFTFNGGSLDEGLVHFQEVHKMKNVKALLTKQFRIHYEDFKKIFNSSEMTVFTPLIFDQRWWGHDFIYIIVIRFNPHDKTLQFLPFILWDVSERRYLETVKFILGRAGATVRPQILFDCDRKTLNDSTYFAVSLNPKMSFNEEEPHLFYSDLILRMNKNNISQQPPDNVRDDIISEVTFKPNDVFTPNLLNKRWPPVIRQVSPASGSKNWDQIGWVGWKDFEEYKQRFTSLWTFQGKYVWICRANIDEKWLVGAIHLDKETTTDTDSPRAHFRSPFLLNAEDTFHLDDNFEVFFAPQKSTKFVAWKDAKKMKPVPVHDEDKGLRICGWNVPPIMCGVLDADMNLDDRDDIYVLVVNEKGKDAQLKCDICGQANLDARALKLHHQGKH